MRRVILLGLVALGFSVPLLISKSESGPGDQPVANPYSDPAGFAAITQSPIVVTPSQSTTGQAGSPFQFAASSGNTPPIVHSQPPVYNAFSSPAEYLNFELTPDWVRARWPRVSISPGEDDLTGMRVALVSGPRPVDVHGSLTYYFDSQQTLQRIAFRGWTGEPSQLVDFLTRQYRFSASETKAAGLFETSSWGYRKGFLRLDYPAVIRQNAETEQLMVLMEIINPASSLTISQRNTGILKAMGN